MISYYAYKVRMAAGTRIPAAISPLLYIVTQKDTL